MLHEIIHERNKRSREDFASHMLMLKSSLDPMNHALHNLLH